MGRADHERREHVGSHGSRAPSKGRKEGRKEGRKGARHTTPAEEMRVTA